MSKRRTPIVDFDQPSLFDPPAVALAGFGLALRETLVDVLAGAKARGMDRIAVAERLTRLDPEREISHHMLNRYCAPSHADHRLPAELIPALYRVTGDPRLMTLVVEACDHKVVPGEAAALGRLMLLEMEAKRIKAERDAVLRQMPKRARDYARSELDRRGGQ